MIEKNYHGKELIAAVGTSYFQLDFFAVDKQGWPNKFAKELLPKEFDAESAYSQFERTVKQRLDEIYTAHKKTILANPELPLRTIIAQEKADNRSRE